MDVGKISRSILDECPEYDRVYLSSDTIVDDEQATTYPVEFLNSIDAGGIPDHKLNLKLNCPVILLRNLDLSRGQCDGTRLICRSFRDDVIEATITTGVFANTNVLIPRITFVPTDTQSPIPFKRCQFPLRLAFCMTINKSQGQTLDCIGLYLPKSVFSHGQLYVSLSRVRSPASIRILTTDSNSRIDSSDGYYTNNAVHSETF